jgi:hypothetical protein
MGHRSERDADRRARLLRELVEFERRVEELSRELAVLRAEIRRVIATTTPSGPRQ